MKINKLMLPLAMAILLGGCASPAKGEVEVKDASSRIVKVNPGSYHRIVCIGAGALRLYSYLGENSNLAGVEDIDNPSLTSRPKMFDGVARPYFIVNGEDYKSLPSCGVGGPNAQTIEAEKILACNPDLVLSCYEDVEQCDKLQEKLGVPVLALGYGYKGVFDDKAKLSISLLGEVLGKKAKAASLVGYIEICEQDIKDRTKDLVPNEKVYLCGLGNWGTTNHLMTAKDYEPFNIAHISNIGDEMLPSKGIAAVEKETLVSKYSQIDKMVVDAAAIKNIKSYLVEEEDLFKGCKAVENGEVYLEMAYNAYYTNLEIALSNTYFAAKSVYPDAFRDVDMDKKLNEITKAFLGKEIAKEIKEYPQSYGGYQKIDDLPSFILEHVK